MRWFKHDCDMHTDLKIQALITKHGAEGYAVWCLCLELLGKEGKKGVLKAESGWKNGLLKVLGWSDNGKISGVFETMAELRLINPKSLNFGNLYIPKFNKRVDDYTARSIRRMSEHNTDKVPLDKNRIDKIRTEYILLKGFKETELKPDDYGRLHKGIRDLILKAGDDALVIDGLHWIETKSAGKWSWTLETLLKKWPDFLQENNKTPFERKWLK